MPSENKNLEEIKDNESNISGGAWYDPRSWFEKKDGGAAANFQSQTSDSSPKSSEITSTTTPNCLDIPPMDNLDKPVPPGTLGGRRR
ncbi:MAG: hypothetical protein IJC57_02970 [Clostridia bacterium]|nr:hypothetical protein [Clostridia bacterium]